MRQLKQLGFTLTELLVVIALVAIVATISIVSFQDFANFQRHERAVAEVVGVIQDARTYARSAVGEQRHGLKFSASSLTQFSGDTYNATDPNNKVYTFSNTTFVSTFPGGVDEITFAQLTAVPSATGTLEIVNSAIPATTTLIITAAGVIQ